MAAQAPMRASAEQRESAPAAPSSTAAFLEALALGDNFKIAETRSVNTKRGRPADIVVIYYSKGSVRDVSKTLRERMRHAGMKLVKTAPVRGGQRLSFASDQAKASALILPKKHIPRIGEDVAGRISLTYVSLKK